MKTTLVAHLAMVGLLFGSAGAEVLAQAQDEGAPRPRLKLPRARSTAVPAAPARPAAPVRRSAAQDNTPKLGVMIDETDDGLVVAQVSNDSVAEAAGVQAGDMLLKMGGRSIDSVDDIRAALAQTKPGGSLTLTVVRQGEGLVKLKASMPRPEPKIAKHAPTDFAANGHTGGFLGVQLGESSDNGVVVDGVVEQSSAWFAGLDKGDLLLSIGNREVSSGEDVVGAIASQSPGSFVKITYERDGEVHNARVRLGSRTPMPSTLGSLFAPGGPGGVRGNVRFGDDIGEWIDDFGQQFEVGDNSFMFDLSDFGNLHDLGDSVSFGVSFDDGVLTIDRDGDVQVLDLSDLESLEQLHEIDGIQGLNLQHLPKMLMKHLKSLDGNAKFNLRVKRSGDHDVRVDTKANPRIRRLSFVPGAAATTTTVGEAGADCCVEIQAKDAACCEAEQDTGDVN